MRLFDEFLRYSISVQFELEIQQKVPPKHFDFVVGPSNADLAFEY